MSSSTTSLSSGRHNISMSRFGIISWVNSKIVNEIERIEDLCTGVAYCHMMRNLAPRSVNLRQVKLNPMGKNDYEDNLHLLREAFRQLKIKQPIPIDLIVQGRLKHNLDFAKVFMEVYEAQVQILKAKDLVPNEPKKETEGTESTEPIGSKGAAKLIRRKTSLAVITEKDDVPAGASTSDRPEMPVKSSRTLIKAKSTLNPKQTAKTPSPKAAMVDKKKVQKPEQKVPDVPGEEPMTEELEMSEEPEMSLKSSSTSAKMKPKITAMSRNSTSSEIEDEDKKEEPNTEGNVQDEDPMLAEPETLEETEIPLQSYPSFDVIRSLEPETLQETEIPLQSYPSFDVIRTPGIWRTRTYSRLRINEVEKEDPKPVGEMPDVAHEEPVPMNQKMRQGSSLLSLEPETSEETEMPLQSYPSFEVIRSPRLLRSRTYSYLRINGAKNEEMPVVAYEEPVPMNQGMSTIQLMRQGSSLLSLVEATSQKEDSKPEREIQDRNPKMQVNQEVQVKPEDIEYKEIQRHKVVQVPWIDEGDKLVAGLSEEMQDSTRPTDAQDEEMQDKEVVQVPWAEKRLERCEDIQEFPEAPAVRVSPFYYYYDSGWRGRRWRSLGCLSYIHPTPPE